MITRKINTIHGGSVQAISDDSLLLTLGSLSPRIGRRQTLQAWAKDAEAVPADSDILVKAITITGRGTRQTHFMSVIRIQAK
jgi:hypothetical protein